MENTPIAPYFVKFEGVRKRTGDRLGSPLFESYSVQVLFSVSLGQEAIPDKPGPS